MRACKDLKKQFSSVVKKTKIGFHVVNFKEKRERKLCDFVSEGICGTRRFISTFFYVLTLVNSQYQSKKDFVRDMNGK